MMKRSNVLGARRKMTRGLGKHRLLCEQLESRLQPGQVLFSYLGSSLVGSALSVSQDPGDATQLLEGLGSPSDLQADTSAAALAVAPSNETVSSTVNASSSYAIGGIDDLSLRVASARVAQLAGMEVVHHPDVVPVPGLVQTSSLLSATAPGVVGATSHARVSGRANAHTRLEPSAVGGVAAEHVGAATDQGSHLVILSNIHNGGGFGPNSVTRDWASYLGGAGADHGNAIKLGGDGNLHVAGSVTDDTGLQRGLVATVSPDGTTLIGAVTFAFADDGGTLFATEAKAVTLDPAGNVYVGGADAVPNDGGGTETFQLAATGDLSSIIWANHFRSSPDQPGDASTNGLSWNASGLWLTGTISARNADGTAMGQFILLAHQNGSDGSGVSAAAFELRDPAATTFSDTVGYAVANRNATANEIYTGLSFKSTVDNVVKFAGGRWQEDLSDPTNPTFALRGGIFFQSPQGPNKALGVVQAPGADGRVSYTGTFADPDFPMIPDLAYANFNAAHSLPDPDGIAFLITSDARPDDGLVGTAIGFDATGKPVMVGAATPDATHSQAYVSSINPTTGDFLNEFFYGGPGGVTAVNGAATAGGGVFYLVGTTNVAASFSTPGVFQETYGGDPSDAFVAQVTIV